MSILLAKTIGLKMESGLGARVAVKLLIISSLRTGSGVMDGVSVMVAVSVMVGVNVIVGVRVMVGVKDGVAVGGR